MPLACSVYLFLGGAIVGATLMAIAIALLVRLPGSGRLRAVRHLPVLLAFCVGIFLATFVVDVLGH